MIQLLIGTGQPWYPANLVDLVVNFIQDSQHLLEKEHYEEIKTEPYGYAGYLRVQSAEGVHNPLVLTYMKKYFGQFRDISELCTTLEATVRKYDEKWWNFLNREYNPQEVLRSMQKTGKIQPPGFYLLRFISESDLIAALRNV